MCVGLFVFVGLFVVVVGVVDLFVFAGLLVFVVVGVVGVCA